LGGGTDLGGDLVGGSTDPGGDSCGVGWGARVCPW